MREHRKIPLTKARLRSAISRGKHVLADVDHRSAEMRRLADLLDALLSDIGGEQASHAKRILAGRACMISLLAELKQQQFARKDMKVTDHELDSFQRLVNTEGRCYERLGLERVPRDVTNTDTIERIVADFAREDAERESPPP